MRIGQGWDSHRMLEGRPLYLGGVVIPSHKGESGHSDGDVLIHALIDALLGAAALGDIGRHFPPSDQAYADIRSTILLENIRDLITENGYVIVNIDTTVILQSPRLAPYIEDIRSSIARTLQIEVSCISVKAKSAEGLGPVGQGESIEAQAAVLLAEAVPELWL